MLEAHDQKESKILDMCKTDFTLWMTDSSEFAGLVRAFARHYELDKNFDINIPGTD